MKRLAILLGFVGFFANAATTKQSFNFKCDTKPKTTSFELVEEGDEVILTTIHANGVDYMPIHDGIIVPHDLEYLGKVASLLKNMGMKNEFRFPKSRCKIHGPQLINCSGGERKKLGDVEMQALHVMTERTTTEFFDSKVPSLKVILDINISGFVPVQEISMIYSPEDCQFSF